MFSLYISWRYTEWGLLLKCARRVYKIRIKIKHTLKVMQYSLAVQVVAAGYPQKHDGTLGF